MALLSQQYYQHYHNGFNNLSKSEIHKFAQSIWDQRNIHPTIPTHNGQQQFILRSKYQIIHELSRATDDFQRSVSKLWDDFKNNKMVFHLTLNSVGGNDKDTTQFLVNCKISKFKGKSGDRITLLCRCIFQQWRCCDIMNIIDTNRFRLECETLNNGDREYTIISIKNAFDIFSSQNTEQIKQYCDHIRNCRWTIADSYPLNLFKIQIENVPIFIGGLRIIETNQDIDKMKNVIDHESTINSKRNRKRRWNDLETNCVGDIIKVEEQPNKKRKINMNIYDEDEYHVMKATPTQTGEYEISNVPIEAEMNTECIKNEGEQQSMELESDLDEELIQHLQQQAGFIPSDNNDIHIPLLPDLENESQRYPSNDLQLTAIQSVILHKSAQYIKYKEQNIEYKQQIITLYEEYNRNLFEFISPNEAQYSAISKSLIQAVTLIHGPPGTGKTSTCGHLVNAILLLQGTDNKLIRCAHTHGKIFVCAHTHNAINELLRKISAVVSHSCILRIGDAARCPKPLKKFCLEEKLKQKDIDYIFDEAKVVIGTIYSVCGGEITSYLQKHNKNVFQWLLIDEATQIMDPLLTIAVNVLQNSEDSHLILVGDHKQLPPVIRSNEIKKNGYKTLFETLISEIDNKKQCGYYSLLNIQYRMPLVLMQFCNGEFYDKQIKSHQKEVDWNDCELQDILRVVSSQRFPENVSVHYCETIPIFVIKIPNIGALKRVGSSWKNENEAEFICRYLLPQLPPSVSTGIISFYKAQSVLIHQHMDKQSMDDVSSNTVDAFQGKEKDLIVLSMVTNVLETYSSHNADHRRINVALSRCKKALIVVTSFDWKYLKNFKSQSYFDGDKRIWRRWFRYFESNHNDNIDLNKERVRTFLQEIKMSEYYGLFIANGFETMDIVCDMTIDDLQTIGISKLGHRKTIQKAVKRLLGVYI